MRGLVDQFHVRFDPALIHQPPDHLGRAVAAIGDQARRGDVEPASRAVEHCFGCADFRLANGRRRLDIHDHRMLQIDEVVVRISITGDRVGRSGVAGRRIGWRDHLWLDRRRPAEGRSSRTVRYSATARLEAGPRSSTLPTPRRRCVRHDHAGVDGEGFASHDPLLHAPRDYGLE